MMRSVITKSTCPDGACRSDCSPSTASITSYPPCTSSFRRKRRFSAVTTESAVGFIHLQQTPLHVQQPEAVHGRLEDSPVPLFAPPQRLLRPFAFGDVRDDSNESDYLALMILDRICSFIGGKDTALFCHHFQLTYP